MKRYMRINLFILSALGIIFSLFNGLQTFAASTNNAANTLKVSPVRRDVEINPGESKKIQTTVTNLTSTSITVRPIENDFISGDDRGTPALILDENEYAPTHSLKRFMGPLDNVTIPANSAKTVDLAITVPKNAQAGGYFGAIRFAPIAPGGGGQVNLSASVASLILAKISGDIPEKLNLTQFTIQQNGRSSELFGNPDNLQVSAGFRNDGGVQEGPFGKISVLQDDKKIIYEADFNNKDPRDVVLPDSTRRWDIPLKNIGELGHYTVNATFTYGKVNQTINVTKSFWVIPQMTIIAVVIGIILIMILLIGAPMLFRNRRKHRSSRRHGGNGLRIHH